MRILKLILIVLLPNLFLAGYSQQAVIRGHIIDFESAEPLPGVNIVNEKLGGSTSNSNGNYILNLPPGQHHLSATFIGYQAVTKEFILKANDTIVWNINMRPRAFDLATTVISASKYSEKLSDVTVSMEVLKAGYIENVQTNQLDETLNLLPGVDVLDGQANIRGGSGFSYGAGSRVMVLLDGLPFLTGDVNEVKWNFLPVEITGQVEVLKGAASALYGSSALNGVINIRTIEPDQVPHTRIDLFSGLYMRPVRKELSWWWDKNPYQGGLRFSHTQKAGPWDLVLGGCGFYDDGYRQNNYQKYGRIDLGVKYNFQKIKGLSAGINGSIQLQNSSDFLIWENADSGAFIQNPLSVAPSDGIRMNLDPFIIFVGHNGEKHSLRTRFYRVNNNFKETPDKNNGSDYYYGEYQYQKEFAKDFRLTAGFAGSATNSRAELYGNHKGTSIAAYAQLDKRFFNRLSASLGLRWEQYTIDSNEKGSRPVMRAGLNYKAGKYTFLRASFGQGYRFPSIAEKYTSTSLGSLKIFPNPELKAETGWSAETGLRQAYKLGNISGFVDLSGYWTEYRNMMEFTFGVYKAVGDSTPLSIEDIGFKSLNVGEARINGFELSIAGEGKAGAGNLRFFAGYTYMNPVDLSIDSVKNILKYRYRHSVKGDFEYDWHNFSAGITLTYRSFMERIDAAFEDKILGQEIFPGLKNYRKIHDKGAAVFDFRAAWQFTNSSKISFIIKNMFNKEYMGRPGDIQPPMLMSLEYSLQI